MLTSPGCDPHATLAELERLALEAGCPEIAAEARALDERPAEGRFFVVCVGLFKRGTSTLLNALVGHPVLPTGVGPVTSAITVLRHGERLRARVPFADGSWRDIRQQQLAGHVAERARQSRQRLETQIRGRISEAHEVAARVLARAREAHAAGADAVRAELDYLDHLNRVVAALTDGQRAAAGRAG